jgi:hypothetical protein
MYNVEIVVVRHSTLPLLSVAFSTKAMLQDLALSAVQAYRKRPHTDKAPRTCAHWSFGIKLFLPINNEPVLVSLC